MSRAVPAGGAGRSAGLGCVLGLDATGNCIAIAALVFAGPLAAGLGLGTVLCLIASIVSTLALSRRSRLVPALGIAQDATIALLATTAAGAAMAADAVRPGSGLSTGIAVIGLSTLLTGGVLWAMGRFRMGRLLGLLPFPVALGFLASSGWLLCLAALGLMTGASGLALGPALLAPDTLPVLVPGLALALTLWLALRVWQGAGALVAVLGIALLGFHLALPLLGFDLAGARALGLLPPDMGGARGLWPELGPVDLSALQGAAGGMAAILLINVVGVILNTSGAELATRSLLDTDQELRASGLANIAIGAVGGPAGYLSAGSSIMAHRVGARHPALIWAYLGVLLVALGLAGWIVPLVPVFLTAGLLLFFGVALLEDWFVRPLPRQVTADRVILCAILAVTIFDGILTAVGLGLVLAGGAFIFSYAQVPLLRGPIAVPRRSTIDRGPMAETILAAEWPQVRIARLQGYLFFGSVEALLALLRQEPNLRDGRLILDCTAVTGIDSSVGAGLGKLSVLAAGSGAELWLCGLAPDIRDRLERWETGFFAERRLHLATDMESALEAIEAAMLAAHDLPEDAGGGLAAMLTAAGANHPRVSDLAQAFIREELAPGSTLIRSGAPERDIFVVEAGRLEVRLPHPDGQGLRLRAFASGAMFGELAFYLGLPRSADVKALGPAVAMRLPEAELARMERDDPELAALFHRIAAQALAEKVVRTNALVSGG
ncbi:MAG: hypothetical protein JG765_1835 [Cereibacter sp.]|jgi:SulP family sulfate permease|nr:hypothetical protein [Cereibacter sp.]